MAKAKPIFERRIFWDVDFENIDYTQKKRFVIERVFDRGDVEDIRQCRRYYGDETIKNVLLSAKYLSERRLRLASVIIDVPITEFTCYKNRLSNQAHLPY